MAGEAGRRSAGAYRYGDIALAYHAGYVEGPFMGCVRRIAEDVAPQAQGGDFPVHGGVVRAGEHQVTAQFVPGFEGSAEQMEDPGPVTPVNVEGRTGELMEGARGWFLQVPLDGSTHITMQAPKGSDNVDPWKIVTDSFKWTK